MPFGDIGTFEYWNAATNRPPLLSGVGGNGKAYVVSVGGATNLDGNNSWAPGDLAVFLLDQWTKFSPYSPAAFNAIFLAWWATLPTSLPATVNQPWNNGGTLSVT